MSLAALREAETSEDKAARRQYERLVDRYMKRADRLTDRQTRNLLRQLADARRQLIDELTSLAGRDGFQAAQLASLRASVEAASARLYQEARPNVQEAMASMWDAGAAFVPETVGPLGVELPVGQTISTLQLVVSQEVVIDQLLKLSQDFQFRARQAVTLGVLGQKSPFQVMRDLGELLRTEPKFAGASKGKIVSEAETLMRTQMMAVFNIANEVRQQEIGRDVPGLKKYWRTARDKRVRPDHVSAGARYQVGGSPGPIAQDAEYTVGGEKARYPQDPRLSSKQRSRCRCVSVLYSAAWFEKGGTS